MTNGEIRELTTETEFRSVYPVLSQLREHYTVDEYLERLSEMRENGYRLFARYDEGDVVGIVGAAKRLNFYNGPHVFVYDLVTDEARRGEGFGTELLGFVHSWANEDSCEYVALESGLWRERTHQFYEDLGYEKFCYSFRKEIE